MLTLGLGLGATTAVFGVVDAVLLRPLPLAEPAQVVALVPRVGGVAVIAAARLARGLLFGVAPHDPVTLIGAALALAAAGLAAAAGPARRVSRVDPVSSLRAD